MNREMKNSGIDWIGEIPVRWETKNLKSILAERKETNSPVKTDFILSLTNDRGVIPYTEKGDVGNKSKDDLTGYKLAYPNDIVLNSMNVVIGSVGLSKYYGAVSPVYYMLYPRKKEDFIEYFNHIFQTKVFQNSLKGYGNGIMEIRMRIQMSKLNTVQLPYPSPQEQQKITEYLDEKVSEIDNIISQTTLSIEEYKKYKQSLITETVTKGLNSNVEMKDSGVEWIGDIPINYDVVRFGSVARVVSNLVHPHEYLTYKQVSPENIEKNSGKLLECKTVSEVGIVSDNHLFSKGQILYSKVRPKLNKVTIATFDGLCSADMYPIETKLNLKYLVYYMLSNAFLTQVTINDNRVKMPKINKEELGVVLVVSPPATEQQEIVWYLDKKCTEIETLITQKQQLLRELVAYKKSLIYECVTGKREVN